MLIFRAGNDCAKSMIQWFERAREMRTAGLPVEDFARLEK